MSEKKKSRKCGMFTEYLERQIMRSESYLAAAQCQGTDTETPTSSSIVTTNCSLIKAWVCAFCYNPAGHHNLSPNQCVVNTALFHKDKAQRGWRRGKWREGAQKKTSESQVVHYMLYCNAGICAPADLVLSALKQPDSSWTDTVHAESLCEIHA